LSCGVLAARISQEFLFVGRRINEHDKCNSGYTIGKRVSDFTGLFRLLRSAAASDPVTYAYT